MSSPSVIVQLPHLIRIRASGDDRARFLHNFCTNEINGLAPGTACEAFFTNVKARILAHGLILAGDDHHEIWMLPGDEQVLLDHLNRYLITEDVQFESVTDGRATIAVIGTLPISVPGGENSQPGTWTDHAGDGAEVRCLAVQWAGQQLTLCNGVESDIRRLQASLEDAGRRGSLSDFERLRIEERFPVIGLDLGEEHLAPEAARDSSAISYTKGCYLGQEPIARIDALGKVNRALVSVELQDASGESSAVWPLSSFDDTNSPAIGLAVLPAAEIHSRLTTVRTPDGNVFSASVTEPVSLNRD